MFGLFGGPAFTPAKDIPSLSSKVILVTGANAGLGKEQVRYLAAHQPAKLYLAARSKEKADAAIADITKTVPDAKITWLNLDLSSLASVKQAAETFRKENTRLDILVNNAGIMAHPPGFSADGYETQFGTNHMGHFLLTRELMPLLEQTAATGADVRVINLSSEGHQLAPAAGFLPETVTTDMAEYSTWRRYGQSKLANILFTLELARRYPAITSVAIHPGGVNTNLAESFRGQHQWLNTLLKPVINSLLTQAPQGALNQTWACVAPLAKDGAPKTKVPQLQQGEYYAPVAVLGRRSKVSRDTELAKKLWEWSEAEVVRKGY